jgi:hypothetical protein
MSVTGIIAMVLVIICVLAPGFKRATGNDDDGGGGGMSMGGGG